MEAKCNDNADAKDFSRTILVLAHDYRIIVSTSITDRSSVNIGFVQARAPRIANGT